MTQSLTVSMTAALTSEIITAHQDAWVVFFDTNGNNPNWTQLNSAGNEGAYSLTLTDLTSPSNQPIFFVIQDRMMSPASPKPSVSGTILSVGDLNWDQGTGTNPIVLNYRMAAFEANFSGKPNDSGDLTNINGYTIPMELTVGYTSGGVTSSSTRGYSQSGGTLTTVFAGGNVTSITGGTGLLGELWSAGGTVHFYSGTNTPMLVAGPGTAIDSPNYGSSFQSADWKYYISALIDGGFADEGNSNQIRLAGYYNGAKDNNKVWHNAGNYSYRATHFTSTNAGVTTSYVKLTPDDSSQIRGAIVMSIDELANTVYQQLGNFKVSGITGSLTPVTQQVGYDTEWTAVIRDLVTGIDGGYFGRTGSSLNPSVTGTINLNQEWNWDPTYIFQSHTTGAIADGPTPAAGQPRNNLYDPWAKVLFEHSNVYGWPFTDNQMNGMSISPLIPLNSWTGEASDSQNISVTLFSNSDQAPSDFTTPQVYNYIAGPYATPVYNTDATNLSLNFSAGTMSLPLNTPVTVRFMNAAAPYDHVTMSSAGYYTMNKESNGYHVVENGGSTPNPGFYQFTHMAFAAGVNWYQIEVGSGSTAKTFNLYWSAGTENASAHLLNPGYVVNGAYVQSGAAAVDGLALTTESVQPTSAYTQTPQVNFTVGGAFYFDPTLLTPIIGSNIPGTPTNSSTGFPVPYAPILGGRSSPTADFEGFYLPQNFTSSATAAQLTPTAQVITTKDVYVGWYGADNSMVTTQATTSNYYVGAYTNKIGGEHVARLTLTGGGQMPINHAALSVTADADGQWTASTPIHFGTGAGTYTVSMTEYLSTDTSFSTSAAKPSAPQTFTINTAADTVSNGQVVLTNGQSSSDAIFTGGGITVSSGGATAAITLSTGVTETVTSSGTAYWGFVSSGGVITISAQGTTSGTVVLSNGHELVSSGGVAYGTDLSTHGHSHVYANATASGMYISGSGSGWILGTAVSTTLAGGWQTISAGGVASNTLLLQGGYEYLSGGITSGSTVSSSGAEFVDANGIARGTVVSANGRLIVSAGGTASGTILAAHGYAYVSAGGTISGAVVSGSGSAWVSGIAVSTTLAGGHQTIHAGGVASGTQLQSGGYEHIDNGGTVSAAVVSAAAIEYVSSGGTLTGATLSGGAILVSSGGIVNGTITFAGGATGSGALVLSTTQNVTASIAGLTNINQYVVVQNVTYGGGSFTSSYNAGTGDLTFGDGTNTATLHITGGSYTLASFKFKVADQGGTMVYDPPSEDALPAGDSGNVFVQAGERAIGTVLGISDSRVVLGTALATTVSGGLQVVSSGGVTSGTQVQADGSEYISAGGSASEAVVWSNGTEVVDSGGLLNGATLSGGTLTVFTGGLTAGTITFAGDGLLKLFDADTFSGTVAGLAGDHATIDLMDVSFADASLTWSAGADGGALTITDGADTATLNLIGQYAASDFQLSSDTGGGTLVHAPPSTGDPPALLVGSHHG